MDFKINNQDIIEEIADIMRERHISQSKAIDLVISYGIKRLRYFRSRKYERTAKESAKKKK